MDTEAREQKTKTKHGLPQNFINVINADIFFFMQKSKELSHLQRKEKWNQNKPFRCDNNVTIDENERKKGKKCEMKKN